MKTLIIVPAFNEADSIGQVLNEIQSLERKFDVVVINDGSTDGTQEAATHAGALVLTHPINLGIGAAMQTGFRYAVHHGYECAVQVDGDGQHPAGEIPKLVDALMTTGADVVIGSRFLERKGFQSTFSRRIGIRYFELLHRMLTHVRITDSTSGFRALSGRALAIAERHYPDEYPEAESVVLFAKSGLLIHEIPILMRERQGGISSIGRFAGLYYMFKVTLAIMFTHLRVSKGRK